MIQTVRAVMLTIMASASLAAAQHFYVAPDGADDSPGTLDQPFGALEAARDAVRRMTENGNYPEAGVTVHLRGGVYRLKAPFELTARDSGRPHAPVRYRAYQQEQVEILGGIALELDDFSRVTDARVLDRLPAAAKDKVLQVNLASMGIVDYGQLPLYGHSMYCLEQMTDYRSGPPAPQLYWDDAPMTLARWPNDGYAKVERVVDKGDRIRDWMDDQREREKYVPPEDRPDTPRGFAFKMDEKRLDRWASAEDLRLYGYWFNNWSDQAVEVAEINSEDGILRSRQPSAYGLRQNQRFYAYNLLEEMDQPGEWYLDRDRGILYVIPPDNQPTPDIQLSLLNDTLITLDEASHVIFEGLNLGCTRGSAITISGGREVSVKQCRVANVGDRGIIVDGGRQHSVSDCEIFNSGGGGVMISGGVRETLTPGGHRVENNLIYDYALTVKTYRAAVHIEGVGHRAAHNEIHSAPHVAILFGGNNHQIAFNHIYDVCRETDDMAAIYAGRDWTARGTVIRNNLIRDLKGYGAGTHRVSGVYLDDGMSGSRVEDNIFMDAAQGLFFSGGRENRAVNNLFMNTGNMIRSFSKKQAYTTWAKAGWRTLHERLRKMPIDSEPWRTAYPRLPGILDDEPELPKYTVIRDNLRFNAPLVMEKKLGIHEDVIRYGTVQNNPEIDVPPGHYDDETGRFIFDPASGVFEIMPSLKTIQTDKIGRQQ